MNEPITVKKITESVVFDKTPCKQFRHTISDWSSPGEQYIPHDALNLNPLADLMWDTL